MAHFVADFLPLNGNDLFDMTGEMPPQLRVLLNVPEDFRESYFKYDEAGTDVEKRTYFENQDKLKNILIERYRNITSQQLRKMRQGRGLGSIGVYNRVIELEAGVTMQYASLWGREYVTLQFAEWLVRRLLEKMTPSGGLYMLIFYNNNKIAAVPMAHIKNPVGHVEINKVSKSDWSDTGDGVSCYNTQLKLHKDSHIAIMNGLKIDTQGRITTSNFRYFAYNTQKTILGCAESEIDDCSFYTTIFNGDGKTIYDDVGGVYSISSTGEIKFQSRRFERRLRTVCYPTATGGWYGPTCSIDFGINTHGREIYAGLYTEAQLSQLPDDLSFFLDHVTRGGPDPESTFFLRANYWSTVDHFPVYSNDGKLDRVDIKTVPMTGAITRLPSAPNLTHQISTSSYGSLSFNLDWTFGRDEAFNPIDIRVASGESDYQVEATLHFGTDPRKEMFIAWLQDGLTGIQKAVDPFGGGEYATDGFGSGFITNFAANGKTFVCLYWRNDGNPGTYRVSVDKADCSQAYKSALKLTDLREIDYILVDIKKSDIDKLK